MAIKHRMRWFVYVDGERIPHTATMRGQWGYDVECSCGEFVTRTGGAVRSYIEQEVWHHKWAAAREATP